MPLFSLLMNEPRHTYTSETHHPLQQVFDPLEFSDNAEPSDIKLWREAEIKHGRLAMLATVGVIVAEVRRRATFKP